MTQSFQRKAFFRLSAGLCVGALAVLHGCGGGGSGSLKLTPSTSSSFGGATSVPVVSNPSSSACSGVSTPLQLTVASINLDQDVSPVVVSANFVARGLSNFVLNSASYNASNKSISVSGSLKNTAGDTIPLSFNGSVNSTSSPQKLSGTLDLTCWRTNVELVAETVRPTATPSPHNSVFIGNYAGEYTITSGPDTGDVVNFTANINSSGTVTSVDAEGVSFPGVADLTTGRINLARGIVSIQLIQSGTSVTGTGTFFNPVNGNRGRVNIRKVGSTTPPVTTNFVGTYEGTLTPTAGEELNEIEDLTFTVRSNGTSTLVDVANDGEAFVFNLTSNLSARTYSGTDTRDGTTTRFNGNFAVSGTTITANGTYNATGAFNQSGRLTLTKVSDSVSFPLSTAIVGTWKVASIATPTGPNQACPATLPIGTPLENCGSNDRATFNSNGTVTLMETSSTPQSGTWSIGGNTLTVRSGTETLTYNITIIGSAMRLAELTYTDTDDTSATSSRVVANLIKQ
jgi:hypothetical protein